MRKLFSSSLLTLHRLVLSRLPCAAGDDGATAGDDAVPLQQAAGGSGPRLECPPGQGPNAARTACEPCGVSPNARLLPAVFRRLSTAFAAWRILSGPFEPFRPHESGTMLAQWMEYSPYGECLTCLPPNVVVRAEADDPSPVDFNKYTSADNRRLS